MVTTTEKGKSKKKIIVIAITSIFALAIGGSLLMSGNENAAKSDVHATGVSDDTGKPVQSQDPNYISEVEKNNVMAASEAIQQEKSHIDTVTNKTVEQTVDENSFLNKQQSASGVDATARLQAEQNQIGQNAGMAGMQQPVIYEKVIYQEVPVAMEAPYDYRKDTSLIDLFNASYAPRTFGINPVSNVGKREELARVAQEQAKAAAEQKQIESKEQAQAADMITLYKVGDLIPATLQTGIDSTQPSVVRARIESGPLAGAIVTGTFEQDNTSVRINFNSLNIQTAPNSIAIAGSAMDFNRASTAMRTSVNRHIPERIAMAFITSFGKGFADAMKNNNITSTSSSSNNNNGGSSTSNTTTSRPKTTREINKEAGAEAISTAIGSLDSLVPKQPTVKVRANMEIAIYLTQDLQINKNWIRQ